VHPVLIEIGRFKIYSYGFMLAVSFLVGIWFAGKRARRYGIPENSMYDLSIVLILSAVLGSRLLYIFTHIDHYRSILDVIALWQGGATFYGGLVLAAIGAVVFLRIKRIPFFKVADVCSPSIGLGIFLTRIGCFLSGCCFGLPTSCPFGLVFPPDSPAGYAYQGIRIHPTQLYSSFYGILIFILIMLIERRKRFDGFTFAWLCILYGMSRFIVDFFRYYEKISMFWDALSVNQLLSLGLVIAGVLLLVLLRRRTAPALAVQDKDRA